MKRMRCIWLVCVLLATALGCGDGTGPWRLTAVAAISSPALERFHAADLAATPEYARGHMHPFEDYLRQCTLVQVRGWGVDRLVVLCFPADDDLEVALLSYERQKIRRTGSWRIARAIASGPSGSIIAGPPALLAQETAGRRFAIWMLDPWTQDLVRWQLAEDGRPSAPSFYSVPWQVDAGVVGQVPGQAAAMWLDPAGDRLLAAASMYSGGTEVGVLDVPGRDWQGQWLWGVEADQLAVMPRRGGGARLFCLSSVLGGWERVCEVADGVPHPVSSGMVFVLQFAAVAGPAGEAHILWVDTGRPSAPLSHAYEQEGGWVREEVAAAVDILITDGGPRGRAAYPHPSACFDSAGDLHVSYFDYGKGAVMHAVRRQGAWNVAELAAARDVAGTSICGAGDGVAVAYVDIHKRRVFVAVGSP